ncbi:hypothetical protein [Hanstruepera marina]|uniref:hypothetical protein n=1 Tax=Hanstruepera marina TaxID=2873265 RepID=UPI001CA7B3BB|nr:hypothetical protein [Hanstruepera marina]
MRNIRLKLILLFLVSSFGVGIYVWVNNFKQIDIFRTKNDGITNSQIHQIKNSTDIEFIRENAINYINWNKKNRYSKNSDAVSQSKLILLQ